MQFLLGLFFSSVLLTTGGSLKCPYCLAINGYCSAVDIECPPEKDACMSAFLKADDKTEMEARYENCTMENECMKLKDLIGKFVIGNPALPYAGILKEVTCSKARPSFASFLPAFLGLLLMKLLF